MSKKIVTVSVALILSFALVGTLGGGVAWAHGGHGGIGSVAHDEKSGGGGRSTGGGDSVVHGGHLGSGAATHGGRSGVGDTNLGGSATAHGTHIGGGAMAHSRKGRKKEGPVALTGSINCSVHGKMTFTPALVGGGAGSSTVTITGLFNRCTSAPPSKVKFNNGHLSALMGTVTANCAALSSGATPALSGGSITWTPPSKVATSNMISMPTGTATVITSGGKSVIQIEYSGGSIGSGSLSNTGGVSVKLTSRQDVTQISGRCTTGLANVAFTGSATL